MSANSTAPTPQPAKKAVAGSPAGFYSERRILGQTIILLAAVGLAIFELEHPGPLTRLLATVGPHLGYLALPGILIFVALGLFGRILVHRKKRKTHL